MRCRAVQKSTNSSKGSIWYRTSNTGLLITQEIWRNSSEELAYINITITFKPTWVFLIKSINHVNHFEKHKKDIMPLERLGFALSGEEMKKIENLDETQRFQYFKNTSVVENRNSSKSWTKEKGFGDAKYSQIGLKAQLDAWSFIFVHKFNWIKSFI